MYNNKQVKERIIKDCIYGHITVPPLCSVFMDQEEFQRLRRIKQLGNVSRVYPSATHTRFEHSIGVMHLAGKMCEQLGLSKGNRFRELIQLAGLYHDIGHLPYSHLFDSILSIILIEKMDDTYDNDDNDNEERENIKRKDITINTHHEIRSLELFLGVSKRLRLLSTLEEDFVCNCIRGKVEESFSQNYQTQLQLYNINPYYFQIVASSATGVDVDKLDYLCRDAYHTGMPSFQADYIICNAMIHPTKKNIIFNRKAYHDIKNMFEMRERMHELVYQHKVVNEYDNMYLCMILSVIDSLPIQMNLCDYILDTFLMKHHKTEETYTKLERRIKDHSLLCICKKHKMITKVIPKSGSINDIEWYEK